MEANRRAILSVTKRRFTDDEVTEEAWSRNFETIVEEINRKVYEDPTAIEVVHDESVHEHEVEVQDIEAGKQGGNEASSSDQSSSEEGSSAEEYEGTVGPQN